jgi:sporulation protein YabP
MPYEEKNKQKKAELPHNMILEDRRKLSIAGVEEVASFDDEEIILYTSCGRLTVRGHELHIGKLSVDTGELAVDGQVDSLEYGGDERSSGGFWARLFG